jgi:hypothetical protein
MSSLTAVIFLRRFSCEDFSCEDFPAKELLRRNSWDGIKSEIPDPPPRGSGIVGEIRAIKVGSCRRILTDLI